MDRVLLGQVQGYLRISRVEYGVPPHLQHLSYDDSDAVLVINDQNGLYICPALSWHSAVDHGRTIPQTIPDQTVGRGRRRVLPADSCGPTFGVSAVVSRPQQALAGWGGGRVRAGVLQKQPARPLTYRPVNNGGSGGKGLESWPGPPGPQRSVRQEECENPRGKDPR